MGQLVVWGSGTARALKGVLLDGCVSFEREHTLYIIAVCDLVAILQLFPSNSISFVAVNEGVVMTRLDPKSGQALEAWLSSERLRLSLPHSGSADACKDRLIHLL